LSHAAGVGQPMPVAIARLMIALKLASLAQGASGVRRETVRLLEAVLAKGLTPVVPAQGSVGASGDLAPLAHMAATLIGVGSFFVDGEQVPAERALAQAGLSPLVLGAKGKILGYTLANDVSAWDIERENALYLPQSKAYNACCSLGPAIVTTDSIADPYNLEMTCSITRNQARSRTGPPYLTMSTLLFFQLSAFEVVSGRLSP